MDDAEPAGVGAMIQKQTSDLEIALERFALKEYLARNGFSFQKRGIEAVSDCFWCGAEEKLSINMETRAKRCFVCQRRFSLLDVVAKIEGGYQEAVSVILSETGAFYSLDFVPELALAVKNASAFSRDPTWEPYPISPPESFEPIPAGHPYTNGRGFPLDALTLLGVGVCTRGRYQDRLVFPVKRLDGAWIYFQTRATWEKKEQIPDLDGKVRYRKNLNPTDPDPKYAQASDVLLGLEHVIRGGHKRVAVVEGPTDWLMSAPAAVALLGKVVSDRHVQLLVRAGVTDIDLCLDPDAGELPVGRDGKPNGRPPPARVAAEKFSNAFKVRVVNYEPGKDPGNTHPIQNWKMRSEARPFGDGSRLSFVP